jgi:hypothetical protein
VRFAKEGLKNELVPGLAGLEKSYVMMENASKLCCSFSKLPWEKTPGADLRMREGIYFIMF